MKFLCLCYYDATKFAAMTPEDGEKIRELCDPHDKALKESGHLAFVGSLGMPEDARTLRVIGETTELEDGPFAATGEPLGAFFMIDAADMDGAVKVASMHPGARLGHIFGGGIELRPIESFEAL